MNSIIFCPKCGKEMHEGFTISGPHATITWFPVDVPDEQIKLKRFLFPSYSKGDMKTGMVLHKHSLRGREYVLPAANCPECKIVVMDYNEEYAEPLWSSIIF